MPAPIPTRIVMLCTGNAARSVMATVMARERRPDLEFIGAGTHALEGLPMSSRTRYALARHGLADPDHRSHHLTVADLERATLVVGFAPDHVAYVRRVHPEASARVATLHHLVEVLDHNDLGLAERVDSLALHEVDLVDAAEVADPAGGDDNAFVACAEEIEGLLDRLLPRL